MLSQKHNKLKRAQTREMKTPLYIETHRERADTKKLRKGRTFSPTVPTKEQMLPVLYLQLLVSLFPEEIKKMNHVFIPLHKMPVKVV